MLKRTVVFSSPVHLCIRHGQVFCRTKADDAEPRVIPTEDLGVVVLENQAITLTAWVLQRLVENGTAVVVCGESHHPIAILQPLEGNSLHCEILRLQVEAGAPLRDRLWQQIVQAKIRNQALVLERQRGASMPRLRTLARSVRSGDPDNREAVAAKVYWQELFSGTGFKRDREGGGQNRLLNYGYSVLRAAMARAVVGSGLHPALGVHHCNRYNAFALADDLMEPYRPFVDREVAALGAGNVADNLTREEKERLLGILTLDVRFGDVLRPLLNALSHSSASLVRCLQGEDRILALPEVP